MDIAIFLQDLFVIMVIAGVITLIFHQLKQPVVLGYILSGVILARHTPPFFLIVHNETAIKALAELGVIFLMFSLGLEFNIRKLLQVGTAALVAALAEIILMILVGYEMGQFFGWNSIDSIFLGAMLAISSTTIIVKALNELGMKNENFAQMIFGILIIEDILAIAILGILSSVAMNGALDLSDLTTTLGELFVFLVASLVIGILFIPKLLAYVARFNNKEMLLIVVLGLCFGFSLLVIKLGYSIALGPFLMGAIMAESQEIKSIQKLIEPLTNMFSAIFFVSIGLLVDPLVMQDYIAPILIITIVLVVGKVLICSLSTFLAGRDGRTSMRVGMGLAQIGEFSFIIASLGISSKVMSPYLYPVIVAVSVITTFLTPYLIKNADLCASFIAKMIPENMAETFNTYTAWLQSIRKDNQQEAVKQVGIKNGVIKIIINLILIIAIFITGSYVSRSMSFVTAMDPAIENTLIWGVSLVISLPFLIAIYRQLKRLSMTIAEMAVKQKEPGEYNIKLRHTISEVIPVAGMLGIMLMIIALSASILPPFELLILIFSVVILMTAILWRWFIKLHSRLQNALVGRFKKKK